MARYAAPEDIAQTVAFLADPARGGFVHGVALPVAGGWTADANWNSLRLRKRWPRPRGLPRGEPNPGGWMKDRGSTTPLPGLCLDLPPGESHSIDGAGPDARHEEEWAWSC